MRRRRGRERLVVRRDNFPALAVSRLPDGGWQLLNQYVLFRSVHPLDTTHNNAQPADDDDEGEEEEASGEDDDEEEQDEGSGEEEEGEGDGEEEEEAEEAYGDGVHVAAEEGGVDDNGGVGVAVQTGRLRHLQRSRGSASDDDEHMHDSEMSHRDA